MMDSAYLEMLAAIATAMGGWKGIQMGLEKWNSRAGTNGAGTRRAVENLEAKLLPHMEREIEASERISDGIEKMLVVQQQTNILLSEIKGRLAQGG